MVKLQYFNGKKWNDCGTFHSDHIAWISLGGDDFGYRTINEDGVVLTDNSKKKEDKIIIPPDLDDEEYKDFLDANFEKCPDCSEYLHDNEHDHDCEIDPKSCQFFYNK